MSFSFGDACNISANDACGGGARSANLFQGCLVLLQDIDNVSAAAAVAADAVAIIIVIAVAVAIAVDACLVGR